MNCATPRREKMQTEISLLLKQLYKVHAKRLFTLQDTGKVQVVVVSVKNSPPAGAYRNDLHPKS